MSKIILVKRIVSITLLIVSLLLLLMGLIQFTLFDSGFGLIIPALVIQMFGYCLMIPTQEEKRLREEKKRERRKKGYRRGYRRKKKDNNHCFQLCNNINIRKIKKDLPIIEQIQLFKYPSNL